MQDYRKLIKPKFKEHYQELLGDNYETFIEHCLKKPTRSIRVNTLKIGIDELKKRLKPKFFSSGFYVYPASN